MENVSINGGDVSLGLYYGAAGEPRIATNGGMGRVLSRTELAAIADWADEALRNYQR